MPLSLEVGPFPDAYLFVKAKDVTQVTLILIVSLVPDKHSAMSRQGIICCLCMLLTLVSRRNLSNTYPPIQYDKVPLNDLMLLMSCCNSAVHFNDAVFAIISTLCHENLLLYWSKNREIYAPLKANADFEVIQWRSEGR